MSMFVKICAWHPKYHGTEHIISKTTIPDGKHHIIESHGICATCQPIFEAECGLSPPHRSDTKAIEGPQKK